MGRRVLPAAVRTSRGLLVTMVVGLALSATAGCEPSAGRAAPPVATVGRPAGTTAPAAGSAAAALAGLALKGRAPKTGYARGEFGPAWTDDNDDPLGHNGCDTRNDILRRDLRDVSLRVGTHGCVVAAGALVDPYTGRTVSFVRGPESAAVQIDHVVALSDAWQKGAQQWTPRKRRDLANDPLNLLAVDGPTNQAKGDGDAATWLPPDKAYRCAYVARQVAVKKRYGLWVTMAERDAINRVLATCPAQRLPDGTTAAR